MTSAAMVLLTAAEIGQFLIEHADLINDIRNAFADGASKEQIKDAIRASMLAAAEADLTVKLGPRPVGT